MKDILSKLTLLENAAPLTEETCHAKGCKEKLNFAGHCPIHGNGGGFKDYGARTVDEADTEVPVERYKNIGGKYRTLLSDAGVSDYEYDRGVLTFKNDYDQIAAFHALEDAYKDGIIMFAPKISSNTPTVIITPSRMHESELEEGAEGAEYKPETPYGIQYGRRHVINRKGEFVDFEKNDKQVNEVTFKTTTDKVLKDVGAYAKSCGYKLVSKTPTSYTWAKKVEQGVVYFEVQLDIQNMGYDYMGWASGYLKKSGKKEIYNSGDAQPEDILSYAREYMSTDDLDEEQINELSPATMKSYVKKAINPTSEKSISNLASRGGYELGGNPEDSTAGEKEDRKSFLRSKGVQRAVNKLTKEDGIAQASLAEGQNETFSDLAAWKTAAKNAGLGIYSKADKSEGYVAKDNGGEICGRFKMEGGGPEWSGWLHSSVLATESTITEKSKSEKQARFMAACAHDANYKSCPPKKVAKEFNKADTGTKQLSNAMKEDSDMAPDQWKVYMQKNGTGKFIFTGMIETNKAYADKHYKERATATGNKYSLVAMSNKKTNEAIASGEQQKFGVYLKGGSIGDKKDSPKRTFDTKEEAVAYAKRNNAQLTPGEKGYYGMKYYVKPMKQETNEEQVNELSPKTLSSYKDKAGATVASFKYGPKGQFMDQPTVNKRAKGLATANKKIEKTDEAKTVFDPLTKKNVPVKAIKQQAGGPVTKNGVPFTPVKKKQPYGESTNEGAEKFVNAATSKKRIADAEKALNDNPNMMHGPKAGFKGVITTHKKHLAKEESKEDNMKTKKLVRESTDFLAGTNVAPDLEKVLRHYGKEVKDFMAGKDLADDLYHALYDYYWDEMPYGTKKARTGDPFEWIVERLDQELTRYEDLPADAHDMNDVEYGNADAIASMPASMPRIKTRPVDEADFDVEYGDDDDDDFENLDIDLNKHGIEQDRDYSDEGAAGDIMPMEDIEPASHACVYCGKDVPPGAEPTMHRCCGEVGHNEPIEEDLDEIDEAGVDIAAVRARMAKDKAIRDQIAAGQNPAWGEKQAAQKAPTFKPAAPQQGVFSTNPRAELRKGEKEFGMGESETNETMEVWDDESGYDSLNQQNANYNDRFADPDEFAQQARTYNMHSAEELDEAFLVEGLEQLITEILEEVGLDHGLDFFFDEGLVAIGKSTARVIINALKADPRIKAIPSFGRIDGEEVQIEFDKQPKAPPAKIDIGDIEAADFNPDAPNRMAAESTVNEEVSMNISATGDNDVISVLRKLSGLGNNTEAPQSAQSTMSSMPAMLAHIAATDSAPEIEVVADTEVDEAEGEYANAPNDASNTYMSTSRMMNQGDKNQKSTTSMAPKAYGGDNAATAMINNHQMKESMRLMKEYELMKNEVKK